MDGNVHILSGLQERYQNLGADTEPGAGAAPLPGVAVSQYRAARTGGETGGQHTAGPRARTGEDEGRSGRHADALYGEASGRDSPEGPDREDRKAEERSSNRDLAKASPDGGQRPPSNSSDLQAMAPMLQLEGQLKANEQEIQDARREMQDLQTQIAAYQGRLNLTPIREQQLTDLTRDYEQSKANYDSLLKKQMQSQLATNLEKRQQGKGFRIIDPPSFAHRPYSPDRVKFSLLGLIAGVLLGFGLVFLSEFLDDHIREEADITRMTNVRVLAGIPQLATPADNASSIACVCWNGAEPC